MTCDNEAVQRYFTLHDEIGEATRVGDVRRVLDLAKEAAPLIPCLVRETKREFGVFDIQNSRAVELGGRLLAAMGDVAALREMERILSSLPDTRSWADLIRAYLDDTIAGETILRRVRADPGILQTKLRDSMAADPAHVSELCYWLARVGRLRRIREGRSYALFAE